MTTRREFLKQATLASVALASGVAAQASSDRSTSTLASQPKSSGKPRRVIFLVSDGMSLGVPALAHQFSLLARGGKGTHFRDLLANPAAAQGLFETHSLESWVTDSAAASTAWGSGVRVLNSGVNTLPDKTKLTPILPLLKDLGFGTGLVTTASITHATPAGFAAVSEKRSDEKGIAPQYMNVVDVALGGGADFFQAKERGDGEDVIAAYGSQGYSTVLDRDGLLAAPRDKRILGLFHQGMLPYTVDHRHSPELLAKVPTLAEMTEHALAVLESNPKGFLLQVEGARIDHAAHGNDAPGLLWDQLAFDDALGVALKFQQRHPDTLIVVTSDHGNANPGLNGHGDGYRDSNSLFRNLTSATASLDGIRKLFKDAGSAKDKPIAVEQAQAILKKTTGIEVSPEHAEMIALSDASGKVAEIHTQHQKLAGILGQVMSNHHGMGWTGTQHTSDYTVIAATGPGQEHFGGLIPNTDAFGIFCQIFGVTHRNPSMTLEQARPYLKTASLSHDEGLNAVHWA